jgi:hypothetical protein
MGSQALQQTGGSSRFRRARKHGVEQPDVSEFWLLERDLNEQAERIDHLAAGCNS